ncbi:MAG TPA: DUF5753 domain-containing protein, partial [Streptomyces sp.]|nr:DUF5753 domain-containing protein [Streptomyces sp.]
HQLRYDECDIGDADLLDAPSGDRVDRRVPGDGDRTGNGREPPPPDEDEIEQLTTARLERAVLLARKPGCVVDIVLDEAALRRRIGGPKTMKSQYEHLLACAERPNVTLQLMPTARGAHAGLDGPMTLMETPECERLVYMEGNDKSTLVSKQDEVGVLARRCAMIRSQALRPEESLGLIEQLASE